jgi:hypothetical protein
MSRSLLSRVSAAVATASLGLALTGCATSHSINTLMAEPSRYANKDVTVKGTVVHSASVLGRGTYQIDDGTGSLWVVSTKGVPRKGAHVKVSGKVRDVADLGSILKVPEAVGGGLVMTESHHKASY